MKNLVIVESPAKAKTIEKFLGKDFVVKSSYGHIRDLSKKNLGIDIEKDFKPHYEIDADKKKIVSELKESVKKSEKIYLASDEDREGEAIAWHLAEVLNLNPQTAQRIVFHEITQKAILNALQSPRTIDLNLVNAQQARRILDRIVGFEISPLLWKKIKPALSAGRVQSVAVRLIVEREREIQSFKADSWYRVSAIFQFETSGQEHSFEAELNKKLQLNDAEDLLKSCSKFSFSVSDIQTKPGKKSSAAPFTTSTLQQEASRKFGFSVAQTMSIAQRLYENGFITYMRTDSTNLSNEAIAAAKEQIIQSFGKDYSTPRQFATKTKGAQEAHEAIRPTYFNKTKISGSAADQKLYELIWKRTLASQMSDAVVEKTTITIPTPNSQYKFIASAEIVKFDGFLKLYSESFDDDESNDQQQKMLPPIKIGQPLTALSIEALEKFSHHPPRYTEASLVKKLEDLGIGRPSTYAPTISTIIQRKYVIKADRPGEKREINHIKLENGKLVKTKIEETYGSEKAKLFPTDIGIVVNDYLMSKFSDILDYGFTAELEKKFDEIAQGNVNWTEIVRSFYQSFHPTVTDAEKEKEAQRIGERVLGTDPKTGKKVSVKIGRYGPMVQIGDATDAEKPIFTSIPENLSLETITLEKALALFEPPKNYGNLEGEPITYGSGRFGPYLKHKGKFYSIPKHLLHQEITPEIAKEIIFQKRTSEAQKIIKEFNDIKIIKGKFGPYLTHNNSNYKIPKNLNPEEITLEQCMEIIHKAEEKPKPKRKTKK
ncbi:MAG TPA: type I DNA topoisomerase [Salinivirgaceae bacterium]|nr:type I DNA topoisomerase [Salinivirgaceae bacterium]